MANYHEMDRDALTAEKAALEQAYKEFQAKGLKLNMARGKPGPHQMDLAMDLLKMTDYTTDAGTDARNYGELEGLSESFWSGNLRVTSAKRKPYISRVLRTRRTTAISPLAMKSISLYCSVQ